MPVNPENREKYLDWLGKEYDGSPPLYAKSGMDIRIPFRSPMLTWATTGGVKVGHISRFWGPDGSGKSLSLLGLIWAAQRYPEIVTEYYEHEIKFLESRNKKLGALKKKKELKDALKRFPDGMDSIIFDTEQRFDEILAEKMGINLSRVEVVEENVIELIIHDIKPALEAFHIIAIDSASNAQSMAEAELAPEKELRASAPRAWGRLKQIRKTFDRLENTMIVIDQVRMQLPAPGQRHVSPKPAPPNVRIWRHNVSLSVEYDQGKRLYLDKNMVLTDDYEKASSNIRSLGTDGKEPHGLEMKCKVQKNSTGRPFRNARMRFMFPVRDVRTGELMQDVGYDEPFELFEIGQYFDIIEKSGAWYYPLNSKFKRGKTKWHGELAARDAISRSPELRGRILARLARDI